ncbi:MAG: hypothetical protein LBT44_10105 [Clostridiales bacterium]|jgi:outer membrane lipoprotein-sorting protein|nr:hypothetical protein [Clostridiales bacterium]
MKVRVRLAALCAAIITLAGCQNLTADKKAVKTQNAYEKIQSQLVNMQSYECSATVEYKSNKGSNVYDTVQRCRITGEYRIEVTGPEKVAGNITLTDGKTIYQYNTRISGKVAVSTRESQERSEIFLTSFIKNYLKSNEVSISAAKMSDAPCTVLEAQVPGGHPYLSSEKLWVDNQTRKPLKMIVYDPQGSERIIVTYKTFEYNVNLDDTIFKV